MCVGVCVVQPFRGNNWWNNVTVSIIKESFVVFVLPEVQIVTQVSVEWGGGGGRAEGANLSVKVFPGARQGVCGGAGGAADHLHPPGGEKSHGHQVQQAVGEMKYHRGAVKTQNTSPFEGVLALRSEVVDVRFEVELEDVIFVDVLRLWRHGDGVSQQGKAGQRVVVLQEAEQCLLVWFCFFVHWLSWIKEGMCSFQHVAVILTWCDL